LPTHLLKYTRYYTESMWVYTTTHADPKKKIAE
jgi:hypothetical protein